MPQSLPPLSGPASSGLSLSRCIFSLFVGNLCPLHCKSVKLSLYNKASNWGSKNKIGLNSEERERLWKHMHLFLFLVMLRRKNLMYYMKSIFSSPETLFSKLGIYFNICLLGNGHLLHRHRVSDIWSLSSRRLWGQSHVSWPHTMWVNFFFFFSISHLDTFFWLNSKACMSSEKHKASNQSKLELYCWIFSEFWTSDLDNVANLVWIMWSTLPFFGLNNAVSTHCILFPSSLQDLTCIWQDYNSYICQGFSF